jgi:hypothetical protein
MSGIGWTFRMMQAANFLILAGWLVLAIAALMRLRHCQLDEIARVLWVIIIVLMPFVGALAFFIACPGHPRSGKQRWTRPRQRS